MPRIHIDRLELRFKGVAPHKARTAVSGLGPQLLREVAQQEAIAQGGGRVEVGEVDLGSVRAARGSSSTALRHTVAKTAAEAIASKIT